MSIIPEGASIDLAVGETVAAAVANPNQAQQYQNDLTAYIVQKLSTQRGKSIDYVNVLRSAKNGEYYWHRRDGANHAIVSTGGETFQSLAYAVDSATAMNLDVPLAQIHYTSEEGNDV